MIRLTLTPLCAPPWTAASLHKEDFWHGLQTDAQGHVLRDEVVSSSNLLTWRGDVRVLLLPASLLSWHKVQLPKLKAAKLQQALGGLLEDQVLDDVDQLHFALKPNASDASSTWVASCDKATLQALCAPLQQALGGIDHIRPEFEPGMQARFAYLQAGQLWCTTSDQHGVQSFPVASGFAVGSDLPLYAQPDAVALAQNQLLAEQAASGSAGQGPAQVILQTASQQRVQSALSHTDLAQFDLATLTQSGQGGRAWQRWRGFWRSVVYEPQWRWARWAVILGVAVQLLGLRIGVWQHEALLKSKRDQLPKILMQSFPQTPVVLDAPLQMQKAVEALRGSGMASDAGDLDRMLAALVMALEGKTQPASFVQVPTLPNMPGAPAVPPAPSSSPPPLSTTQLSTSTAVPELPLQAARMPPNPSLLAAKNQVTRDEEADEMERDDESEPPPIQKPLMPPRNPKAMGSAEMLPAPVMESLAKPAPMPVPGAAPTMAMPANVLPSVGGQKISFSALQFQKTPSPASAQSPAKPLAELKLTRLLLSGERPDTSALQTQLNTLGYQLEQEGEQIKVVIKP